MAVMRTCATGRPPALEWSHFTFAYPGGQPLFAPIDIAVREGEFVLFVGDTGSGKTTLLTSAKAEIAPAGERNGHIKLFGHEVCEGQSDIAYVAQDPDNQLICDTVWHEMAFGLENAGTQPDTMRRRVAESAYFFGIGNLMHRSVESLSGGQKQEVNLAAALALQPRILLLDEPCAQLDPVAAKNFLHLLLRVNRELGITVVVATHEPEQVANYATRCVELSTRGARPLDLERFATRPLDVRCLDVSLDKIPHEDSLVQENGQVNGHSQASLEQRVKGSHAQQVNADHTQGMPTISSNKFRFKTATFRSTVSLRDAYVRYGKGESWVLSGCDFEAQPGSVQAIVGGNGCGKSTLLLALAGILRLERGRRKNSLAAHQAFLPQAPQALFTCDTVAEELTDWQANSTYSDADITRQMHDLGLEGLANRNPLDLSGGQRQLVAFAKLALTNPHLLLLDEPSKGLDAQTKCVLRRELRRMADQGCTIILATHDLPFAALVADRVSLLFDGQMVCSLPPQEFFRENLIYQAQANRFTDLVIAETSK
ncbi:ABC transporter ATP-binding protein [Cryptobacterium curtum]|uniref:ABC transporter ATP-binding protein n=1 Tax=Cryptobacterium curtum TaxID=84163 RepID=UPI0028D89A32|nr:ABC transporter ATP-binding protein [Cryptobacterium curtum]